MSGTPAPPATSLPTPPAASLPTPPASPAAPRPAGPAAAAPLPGEVTDALDRLSDLDALPLAEHVTALDQVHRLLQDALATLDAEH